MSTRILLDPVRSEFVVLGDFTGTMGFEPTTVG